QPSCTGSRLVVNTMGIVVVAVPSPAQAIPPPEVVTRLMAIRVLLARGRQLKGSGDIPNARLVLQQAAEAGDATAALELGATYDPIELEKWYDILVRRAQAPSAPVASRPLQPI